MTLPSCRSRIERQKYDAKFACHELLPAAVIAMRKWLKHGASHDPQSVPDARSETPDYFRLSGVAARRATAPRPQVNRAIGHHLAGY
jgi:hypothetical protein